MSNGNVRHFKEIARNFADEGGFPPGGNPPDNGDMELTERVANLETDMKDVRERLTRIEVSMATKDDIADLKVGIADLKVDMHKQHIDIQRWMIATVIGLFLGFGGLFLAMSNALKTSAPPAQQQPAPIFIQVPTPAPVQAPTAPPKP